jgi:hypothetical protein
MQKRSRNLRPEEEDHSFVDPDASYHAGYDSHDPYIHYKVGPLAVHEPNKFKNVKSASRQKK